MREEKNILLSTQCPPDYILCFVEQNCPVNERAIVAEHNLGTQCTTRACLSPTMPLSGLDIDSLKRSQLRAAISTLHYYYHVNARHSFRFK
jgi:hypothetical protein